MSSSAPHRLLRTAVATSMATAAGAGAHLLGGGTVDLPGITAVVAAMLVPIWLLTGRERRFAVIAVVQLTCQQVVHAALELAGPNHVPLPDDVSLYGHLLAAAAIAGWLRSGERRLWAAARRAVGVLVACWQRRGAAPPPVLVVAPVVAGTVRTRTVLRHVLHRRGPPLAA